MVFSEHCRNTEVKIANFAVGNLPISPHFFNTFCKATNKYLCKRLLKVYLNDYYVDNKLTFI